MPHRGGPLLPGQRPLGMGRKEAEFSREFHKVVDKVVAENHHDIYLETSGEESLVPTLFVPRDPHRIRSFADTGVSVRIDDELGKLVVRLNDPVIKAEHSIDCVRTDDVHKLCLCCYDALNYFCKYREERIQYDAGGVKKEAVFYLPNTVVHHANLFSLYAFANVGQCYICNIIVKRIEHRWKLNSSHYEDYRLEMAFPQHESTEKQRDEILYFALVRSDKKKEPVWNWAPLLRLSLWREDEYKHHFRAFLYSDYMKSQQSQTVASEEGEPVELPSPHELATAWVVKCIANEAGKHVPCKRPNSGYLPTRLLDVRHALESSKLRVVCPKDQPARFFTQSPYATLSHCWGAWGAAENPILTKTNLQARKEEGLSCDSLPKTFRDALEVCSWLRIPYLWIDSLCILQDSRPDWIYEASVMHQTYQFGAVNISASLGTDSRSGLFADRNHQALSPQRFQAPKIPRTWYVTSDEMFAWSRTAPAFTRAWIHRERQIAPRILHFTSEGMVVWECCGTDGASFASEILPGGAPFKELWYGNTKYQSTTGISSWIEGVEVTYITWDKMCEKFSTKRLTVASDMPIILSSLAEDFHTSLPDDIYLAGMWRNTLPQALAWHTKRLWPEGDTSKIAPSWSWLSTPAPTGVEFHEHAHADRTIALAKIMDVEIVPEEGHEANMYGPVKSGTLRLEGFLRKIWFDFDEDGKFELSVADSWVDGDEDNHGKARLRSVGKSWVEYEGQVCELELDGNVEDNEYCCWCMFTSIDEWVGNNWDQQDRTITAILLEQLGEEEDERWTRIGMMTMKDLIAFKMRYKDCLKLDPKAESKTQNDTEKEGSARRADEDRDYVQADREGRRLGSDDENVLHETIIDTHDLGALPVNQQSQADRGVAQNHGDAFEKTEQPQSIIATDIPETQPRKEAPISQPTDNEDADPTPDHDPSPDKDVNPASTSDSAKKDWDSIWTSLSNIIKYDRFEVSHAEDAKKKERRKAKRDLEDKLAPVSGSIDRQEQMQDPEVEGKEAQDDGDKINSATTITQDTQDTTNKGTSEIPQPAKVDANANANVNSNTPPTPTASRIPLHLDETTSNPPKIPSGKESNPSEFLPTLPSPNAPPIGGFIKRSLSPLEALYQFDGVIDQYYAEGEMDWLRRLDVRTIEII